jgi:hypothetical protein
VQRFEDRAPLHVQLVERLLPRLLVVVVGVEAGRCDPSLIWTPVEGRPLASAAGLLSFPRPPTTDTPPPSTPA